VCPLRAYATVYGTFKNAVVESTNCQLAHYTPSYLRIPLQSCQLLQSPFNLFSALQSLPYLVWRMLNNVPMFKVHGEMAEISLLFWLHKSVIAPRDQLAPQLATAATLKLGWGLPCLPIHYPS